VFFLGYDGPSSLFSFLVSCSPCGLFCGSFVSRCCLIPANDTHPKKATTHSAIESHSRSAEAKADDEETSQATLTPTPPEDTTTPKIEPKKTDPHRKTDKKRHNEPSTHTQNKRDNTKKNDTPTPHNARKNTKKQSSPTTNTPKQTRKNAFLSVLLVGLSFFLSFIFTTSFFFSPFAFCASVAYCVAFRRFLLCMKATERLILLCRTDFFPWRLFLGSISPPPECF